MITASMLQGIYENSAALVFFGIGLLVKIILQAPSIFLLEAYGPLISTTIGFAVASYFNLRKLHQKTGFNISLVVRRTLLIVILTVVMILATWLTRLGLGTFLSVERKFSAFLLIMGVASVGGFVYIYLGLKTRLADKLLGPNVIRLRRKLRIK